MLPWRFVGVISWRVLLVWLAIHLAAVALGGPLFLTFRAILWALAVTVALLLADAERRSERRFLANLGFSRWAIVGVIVVCFIGFEVVLRLGLEGRFNN